MELTFHNDHGITFPPIPPAFQEGDLLFGRFKLLTPRGSETSELGRGSSGSIHLAQDILLGQQVALKLAESQDPTARTAFIAEAQRSINLAHPGIVSVHDLHDDGSQLALSMQLIPGGNLHTFPGRKSREGRHNSPLTIDQISPWVQQLCTALTYLHEDAQLAHRDLKPHNLLLETLANRTEKLYLTDFGISQPLGETTHTHQDTPLGTLPYMSPQQLSGKAADPRDDLYSLGACLYDLLTGRPPFYEGSYDHIRSQIQEEAPPLLSQRLHQLGHPAADLPPQWEETIAACLAKKRSQRPRSAHEVAQRLDLADDHSNELNTLTHELNNQQQEAETLRQQKEALQQTITRLQSEPDGQQEVPDEPPTTAPHAVSEQELDDAKSTIGRLQEELAALRANQSPPLRKLLSILLTALILGLCAGSITAYLTNQRASNTLDISAYSDQIPEQPDQVGGPITVGLFKAFAEDSGVATTDLDRLVPGLSQMSDNQTVHSVSYYIAESFCAWLTQKVPATAGGNGQTFYRIPTQEELQGTTLGPYAEWTSSRTREKNLDAKVIVPPSADHATWQIPSLTETLDQVPLTFRVIWSEGL